MKLQSSKTICKTGLKSGGSSGGGGGWAWLVYTIYDLSCLLLSLLLFHPHSFSFSDISRVVPAAKCNVFSSRYTWCISHGGKVIFPSRFVLVFFSSVHFQVQEDPWTSSFFSLKLSQPCCCAVHSNLPSIPKSVMVLCSTLKFTYHVTVSQCLTVSYRCIKWLVLSNSQPQADIELEMWCWLYGQEWSPQENADW